MINSMNPIKYATQLPDSENTIHGGQIKFHVLWDKYHFEDLGKKTQKNKAIDSTVEDTKTYSQPIGKNISKKISTFGKTKS